MTALEVSNKFGCAFVEGTSSEHWINAMKEYARLQIEKDRERVKANVRCIDEGNINGGGEYEEYYVVDLKSIDETPIILD